MPHASNSGVKIYYEVEGNGPPLVLAHGVTRSLLRWRQIGFAQVLRENYRLIMFDARGHGKSDKPNIPDAYGINMVEDVLAVLDHAGVQLANYFGYSMGAGIGFKEAVTHPERFSSFILGGWNPYPPQPQPSNVPSGTGSQAVNALRADRQAFLRVREQEFGRPMTPEEKQAELSLDPDAIGALMMTFREVATLVNEDLKRISVPCLLYAGDADPFHIGAKEAANHISGATFFSLPGLDHVQTSSSPLVLPHVMEFLNRVTGQAHT
jgi:pimeloyl-ACP methyl ester carboxylesterase